tara:strand:- start:62 stop:334 length:273 start_codon:yes stop_codon:yes gene_type:complete
MENNVEDQVKSLKNLLKWIKIDIHDKKLLKYYEIEINKDINLIENKKTISFSKYAEIRSKLSKLGQLQCLMTQTTVNQEWNDIIEALNNI